LSVGINEFKTPAELFGLPKRKAVAGQPRKQSRKRGRSMIATDTPEKEELLKAKKRKEEEAEKKAEKKRAKTEKARKKPSRNQKNQGKKPKISRQKNKKKSANAKRALFDSESEEESESEMEDDPDSGGENFSQLTKEKKPKSSSQVKKKKPKKSAKAKRAVSESESEEENESEMEDDPDRSGENSLQLTKDMLKRLKKGPSEGEYVLVRQNSPSSSRLRAASTEIFSVAKVLKEVDDEGDIEVSFLRLSKIHDNKFVIPDDPYLDSVPLKDVKMILGVPKETDFSSSKGGKPLYYFNINFSKLRMC